MLLVAIISNRDLVIQSIENMAHAKRLRARLPDCAIIVHDSVFHCPILFDTDTPQLMEDEVIEFLRTQAYPDLIQEGRMIKVNGHYRYPHPS